ncbi:hypothetical protein IPV08_04545 [Methylobacterium sp. SD274]|jgi:hypothetical protein|uniref:hypothetical protein n=1 Tax=Methylobacterium sp. SD274 TaxID=2782009 RepID=UPI001A969EF5|nr:hypothetical protein [Methylobacterium sp. SD274]MBO1019238.1 hypothetical protein [Methylobacterium sp. SD274]
MNTRITSAVAAIVLSVSAVASPALAKTYLARGEVPAYEVTSSAPSRVTADDDLTTGSIGYSRGRTSAQEGNAEQNSFPVWQYGRTSGGNR